MARRQTRPPDLADIQNPDNAEGALIAAVFAAHGYIVVASNYAGYATSSLPYHPFLNGDQQSKDMIDALDSRSDCSAFDAILGDLGQRQAVHHAAILRAAMLRWRHIRRCRLLELR